MGVEWLPPEEECRGTWLPQQRGILAVNLTHSKYPHMPTCTPSTRTQPAHFTTLPSPSHHGSDFVNSIGIAIMYICQKKEKIQRCKFIMEGKWRECSANMYLREIKVILFLGGLKQAALCSMHARFRWREKPLVDFPSVWMVISILLFLLLN